MGSRVSGARRADEMFHVLVVFVADVLHQLLAWSQARRKRQGKRPGVGAWIVDRDSVLERPVIFARPPLDRMKLLGVGVAAKIKPEPVVEPDRVDHERIAFPPPD